MAVHLVFGRPRHTGGPVHLVFGGSGPVVVPDPVAVSATVEIEDIDVVAQVQYDNRMARTVGNAVRSSHQPAARLRSTVQASWGATARRQHLNTTPWQPAQAAQVQVASAWGTSLRVQAATTTPWQLAAPAGRTAASAFEVAARRAAAARSLWQLAAAVGLGTPVHWEMVQRLRRGAVSLWQPAKAVGAGWVEGYNPARPQDQHARNRWELARHAPQGRTPGPVPPVTPGTRVPSTHLVFACPRWLGGPVHLVFGHTCIGPTGPTAPLYILPARYYMAVHNLVAHRLPDLTPIAIFDLSLSADAGSFGWTFSASAPVAAFDALAPSAGLPAQVRFTLDGLAFTFVVDSLQREEAFGRRSVRFAGRSATALLARPYARETSRGNDAAAATAQQLAEQALDLSGVALDWGLTDWLVPAGAWSHTGTPLAAVQAIVEAAGGYLQSHRSAATLLARHPYPELAGGLPGGPWNWYAPGVLPDVELATDSLITQRIERRDGADLNGVYVSGTNQGVNALVRRTGSAADKLASLITDPLITAQEVALQRGLATLAAAGPKHMVTLDLPVLTGASQPGVLDVGQLVQVNTSSPWRGRVRGVSVNASMPKVRQSVQIERHLETV